MEISIWFNRKYNCFFEESSLTEFNKFNDPDLGILIRKEREKTVRYFTLERQGETLGFYIKESRPSLLSHLKYLVKQRRFCKLTTRHELDLLRLYKEQGVSVVDPAVWGEKRFFGIPVSGFLVQREVVGKELTELLIRGDSQERISLLRAYGKFVARQHSAGLLSSVARVTDMICTSQQNRPWDDIVLVVIDRERGPLCSESYSLEKASKSLADILVRFLIYVGVPTTKEICYFLKTYLQNIEIDKKPSFHELFHRSDIQFKSMKKIFSSHFREQF